MVVNPDMGNIYLAHIAVHKKTSVLGYVVSRYQGGSTIRIERLLVAPPVRRFKIASRLMVRLVSDKPDEVDRMIFNVPEGDLETQLFLRSVGFKATLPIREGAFPTYSNTNGIRFVWRDK